MHSISCYTFNAITLHLRMVPIGTTLKRFSRVLPIGMTPARRQPPNRRLHTNFCQVLGLPSHEQKFGFITTSTDPDLVR